MATQQAPRTHQAPSADAPAALQSAASGRRGASYAAGCLWSLTTGLITATMLFINGSFVLALVSVLVNNDVPIIGNERLAQVLLFTVPVVMAVVEWWMLDYVRKRVTFSRYRTRKKIS
ncbi:MAG: hypothetical protein AAF958_05245 [Planctomycetota bacterium]